MPGIVLVKPPERSRFDFGAFSLATLAAAVRDLAEVEILDATDLPLAEAVDRSLDRRPEIVGVTAMGFSSVAPAAAFVRALVARACSRLPLVVAGGHGASSLPGELLAAGARAVVVGEGEVTFRRLVADGAAALAPGEPGLALAGPGGIVVGPPRPLVFPLDRLPPVARDLLCAPPDGVHLLETSRGCPHACGFCEATRFYGQRWRAFSIERVVSEVRRLVEEHGAYVIELADDNFTANPVRAVRLCAALASGPLPAFFMVSARADDLVSRDDLLPAMAAARMLRVSVGVETLDPGLAAAVGKPIPEATYRLAFERMRQLGMFSVASLIVGLPGETPEARARAVDLAVEAASDAARFVPFLPVPGAPLSAARPSYEADPMDAADAGRFTRRFYEHPKVRSRLDGALHAGGIRTLLARGTIERHRGPTAALSR
jgi:radical SAM superfamily enzyme YgiQ (UPF0313 family)